MVAIFLGVIMFLAISLDNYFLAVAAILAAVAGILAIKSRVKGVTVDERVLLVGDKAARATYSVVTLTLGLGSLLLVFFGKMKETNAYLEGLGYVLSYLTIFSIFVYSAAFWYFNRKFGSGEGDEE